MISELFLAAILSTSFSVRTPNDDTKPLDYEYSIRGEKTEGNFTYNIKRDWERELGEEYVDDVFGFTYKADNFYGGVDYIDKQSKGIKYSTYNLGIHNQNGFKIGVAVKEDNTLFSTSFDKKLKKDDLEYKVSLSIKTNLYDTDIYSIKSEVKKWFGKFNIFGLYKHEYYNKREDFQFKVGIGVKL